MADKGKKEKMDLDLEQQLAVDDAEQDRLDDRRDKQERRKIQTKFEGPDRRKEKDRRKKD